MKIIISPAKKMNSEDDFLLHDQLPAFLEKTEILLAYLKSLSYAQLKKLLACNDSIAQVNFLRYQQMDLYARPTPALLAYEGIQYQYMAPSVFTEDEFRYIQAHLRILSGFYGILRPMDGVVPYRLEMQAKLKTNFCKNLYDFWGDCLFRFLKAEDDTLVNLSSGEYSKAVLPYIKNSMRVITPIFGEQIQGKIKEKGVYVKMARGEMVRYLAQEGATNPEIMKEFDRLGYRYHPEYSDDSTWVFLRDPEKSKTI